MRILIKAFIFLPLLLPAAGGAQKLLQNLEIGLGPGIYIYQGDLAPYRVGSLKTPTPGLHLWAAKQVKKDLAFRVGFSLGGLRGNESRYNNPEYRQERNLKFSATLFEVSALAVYSPESFPGRLSPYLLAGGGLSLLKIVRDPSGFNPAYFDGKTTQDLAADMARPLPRRIPVIPVGAGLKYAISPRWSAYAENVFRFTRTDYLDGFSKVANPDRMDNYHSTTVGLAYNFGKKVKAGCPAVN